MVALELARLTGAPSRYCGVDGIRRNRPGDPRAARAANAQIIALAENLERGVGEQSVAFFCECGCRDIIPMTISRYRTKGGAWLPGHQPAS
jgi:hypothetical protein